MICSIPRLYYSTQRCFCSSLNWLPKGSPHFTFIARRWPSNTACSGCWLILKIGEICQSYHTNVVVLSRLSEIWFPNFVFQIGSPLEASRILSLHLPLGVQLGTWLHLTTTFWFFFFFFSSWDPPYGTLEHLPSTLHRPVLLILASALLDRCFCLPFLLRDEEMETQGN